MQTNSLRSKYCFRDLSPAIGTKQNVLTVNVTVKLNLRRGNLIVGGYKVSFHAQPRATKDLDILIGADAENSKAVFAALAKFGATIEGLSAKEFAEPDNFFRMGTPPVMVDIMPKISGIEFDEAWKRRVDVRIDDDLSVPFISREDLLVAKLSAGIFGSE
jgi:hypothetical protein